MQQFGNHIPMPNQVIDLMVETANHFGGQSAIDPWLHEAALLRGLSGVSRRVGLIRHAALWRQLAAEEPQLELRHANVFEIPTSILGGGEREMPFVAGLSPDRFDIVLWGPPWGEMVQWLGRRHRVETFLLDRAVELLAPGGVAVCLVPPNVLMAPLWKATRRRLMRDYSLEMTVDLPHNLFAPVHLRSTMVVVRRTTPRKAVFMAEYRPDHQGLLEDLQNGTGEFHVVHGGIRDRWDRNFHDPRRRLAVEQRLHGFPVQAVGELAEVIPGVARYQDLIHSDGEYLLVTGATLNRGQPQRNSEPRCIRLPDDERLRRCVLQPGDIIVSAVQPRIYVYRAGDPPSVAASSVIIIRAAKNEYLAAYLQTDEGRSLFAVQVDRKGTRLGGHTRITAEQLRYFQVPVIPLSHPELLAPSNLEAASRNELEQLSAELLAARRENLQLRHRLEQEEARRNEAQARAFDAEQRWQQSGVTQAFIDAQFTAIQVRLNQISASIEHLHESIKSEFLSAKNSNRKIEEKVALMRGSLDRAVAQLVAAEDTYAIYVNVVKTWLEDWERLEPLSLTFLASGEHLFDVLTHSNADDLSPFVLQYCRALENELLCRLFCAFQDSLIVRLTALEDFLGADLQNDKVRQFARAVQRDRRDHTIGIMAYVLGLTRQGGRTLAASPLLTDFAQFLFSTYGSVPTSEGFVSQLNAIVSDYRNRAAHPHIIDQAAAAQCQRLIRAVLPTLIESYSG